MEQIEHSGWSGQTGGLPWMQQALIFSFRWMNIRVLYAFMAMVVPFYMLFNHSGYLSTYRYFRFHHEFSPLKSFAYVYLNHFVFGQIILDRFAFYAGVKFDISIEGLELYNELASGSNGFIQLSSHIGNYELAGYHLTAEKKTIHALVFAGETETVMENREKMFAGHNIGMIRAKADMSHIYEINNAMSDGDVVSMPGDRVFGSSKTEECMFLGTKAKFPIGAYSLAAMRQVPILCIFVMKESVKGYRIIVKRIDVPDVTGRKAQSKLMAQQFASYLEQILRQYPTQWFNYYDFWSK